MPNDLDNGTPGKGAGRARRGGLALFAFVARALEQVSSFVIILFAARFLLPAEYGVYAIAVVFITLIEAMTYTGFYQFIVTSKDEDRKVLSTGFWMIVGLATAGAGLLAGAAWPLAWAFDAAALGPVLLLLAAVQPVAGVNAWFAASLLRRRALKLHFTTMFVQNLVALIGGVVLLSLWQSLYALVAYRYLRLFTGTIFYFAFSVDRPGWSLDRALARKASRFAGGLYGSRLLNFLSKYAGDLLLGLMFTTAAAGLFRFGNRVAGGAIDVVSQPMRSFALTQFSSAERAEEDLSGYAERFSGTTMLLTGGVAAIVIVFAPAVISGYFNAAYLDAIAVVYAMAIVAVARVGVPLVEATLTVRGHTHRLMRFNVIWAVANVLAVFSFAPLGLAVLAWSQVAVALLRTVSSLWMVKQEGVAVRGAVRSILVALVLVSAYGLAISLIWARLQAGIVHESAALALGLTAAVLLAMVTLLVGWRARVFSLGVFSG